MKTKKSKLTVAAVVAAIILFVAAGASSDKESKQLEENIQPAAAVEEVDTLDTALEKYSWSKDNVVVLETAFGRFAVEKPDRIDQAPVIWVANENTWGTEIVVEVRQVWLDDGTHFATIYDEADCQYPRHMLMTPYHAWLPKDAALDDGRDIMLFDQDVLDANEIDFSNLKSMTFMISGYYANSWEAHGDAAIPFSAETFCVEF